MNVDGDEPQRIPGVDGLVSTLQNLFYFVTDAQATQASVCPFLSLFSHVEKWLGRSKPAIVDWLTGECSVSDKDLNLTLMVTSNTLM